MTKDDDNTEVYSNHLVCQLKVIFNFKIVLRPTLVVGLNTILYIMMICNQHHRGSHAPFHYIRRFRRVQQDWVLILTFYNTLVSTLCMLLSQPDRLSTR